MAFILEKTPEIGEQGRDFYDFIDAKVTQPIRNDWVIDRDRGIVLFYTGNNSRALGDGAIYPKRYFTLIGKDFDKAVGVYEEIVSKTKISEDCLLMQINLQLTKLTPELWEIAKEALAVWGAGPLARHKNFKLLVLNDSDGAAV